MRDKRRPFMWNERGSPNPRTKIPIHEGDVGPWIASQCKCVGNRHVGRFLSDDQVLRLHSELFRIRSSPNGAAHINTTDQDFEQVDGSLLPRFLRIIPTIPTAGVAREYRKDSKSSSKRSRERTMATVGRISYDDPKSLAHLKFQVAHILACGAEITDHGAFQDDSGLWFDNDATNSERPVAAVARSVWEKERERERGDSSCGGGRPEGM